VVRSSAPFCALATLNYRLYSGVFTGESNASRAFLLLRRFTKDELESFVQWFSQRVRSKCLG
jgi:hypothetical protein